MIVVRSCP